MSSPTVRGVERALIQQRERLETLTEISRVVSATLDLRTLYDTIYQQVGRVMDTTRFFIALHRPDHNMIQLPYHREDGELGIDAEIPYGKSVTTSVIEQGIALLFRNSDDYSTFAHKNQLPEITIGDEGSQSMIFVPLNTGSRTIGAMSVQCTARDVYTPDDVQTLSVIASQAAVAIVNARLYRQGEALLQAANKISSSHGLQAVLDAILNGMYDVMSYSFATIFLPNFAQERLEIVGAAGEAALQRRGALTVDFGKGVTGRVFATGNPMIVSDVRLHSDYIGDGVTEVGSEIAVPLKHNDTVIGVLNVERSEVDAFTREDLNLLTLFASQVALAIENARLFSEQENRVFELQTIQSIVQKLTPLHDPAFIADLIDRELKALIDYHSCRLFVLDQAEDRLLPMNEAANDRPGWQPRVGEGITGWIAQRGQPVLIENTLEDTRVTQIPGTPRRVESLVGAPLVYEGRVRGVITLSKLGVGQFDRNSLRLLEIVAAQTAIAFDRARLYDELKTDAVTDDLTKLHNRRYLLERFREERSRAVRNQHALAVIMLDIDKFKSVNDTYGHDAGDVVLCELADVVRRIVRAEDIVARYGGEEFCVLLPETSFDGVDEAAERLRSTVESHLLPHRAGIRQITVSVGVSLLEVGDSGTEVLTRADQALYRVKAEGGNRVCILHGETPHFNEEKSGDAGDDVAAPSASEEIADLRRAEAALHHQALYDSLTGLPNRTLLIDRLQQAVLTSNRESAPVGLLLMDLDRFKDLNDALGYSVGDRLLREIAGRLRSMLR
ncbi:MAG TPA: diguanylate cyclase, partial [Chloroflexota bacterium]